MADKQLINVAAIPGAELEPDVIDTAAAAIRTVGTDVSGQGLTVLTTWQRLSGSYEAPEDDTLFGAMTPVKSEAEAFGTDVARRPTPSSRTRRRSGRSRPSWSGSRPMRPPSWPKPPRVTGK